MTQREQPGITAAELEATLGVSDATVSGGRIENFREGWAVRIMGNSEKAHYFRRQGFATAVALCDFSAPVRWLFGRGNVPHCQKCAKVYRDRKVAS